MFGLEMAKVHIQYMCIQLHTSQHKRIQNFVLSKFGAMLDQYKPIHTNTYTMIQRKFMSGDVIDVRFTDGHVACVRGAL